MMYGTPMLLLGLGYHQEDKGLRRRLLCTKNKNTKSYKSQRTFYAASSLERLLYFF